MFGFDSASVADSDLSLSIAVLDHLRKSGAMASTDAPGDDVVTTKVPGEDVTLTW